MLIEVFLYTVFSKLCWYDILLLQVGARQSKISSFFAVESHKSSQSLSAASQSSDEPSISLSSNKRQDNKSPCRPKSSGISSKKDDLSPQFTKNVATINLDESVKTIPEVLCHANSNSKKNSGQLQSDEADGNQSDEADGDQSDDDVVAATPQPRKSMNIFTNKLTSSSSRNMNVFLAPPSVDDCDAASKNKSYVFKTKLNSKILDKKNVSTKIKLPNKATENLKKTVNVAVGSDNCAQQVSKVSLVERGSQKINSEDFCSGLSIKRVAEDRTGFSPDAKKCIEKHGKLIVSDNMKCKSHLMSKFEALEGKSKNSLQHSEQDSTSDISDHSDILSSCSLLQPQKLMPTNIDTDLLYLSKGNLIELNNLIFEDSSGQNQATADANSSSSKMPFGNIEVQTISDDGINNTLSQMISSSRSPEKPMLVLPRDDNIEMAESPVKLNNLLCFDEKELNSNNFSKEEQNEIDAIAEFMNDSFDDGFAVDTKDAHIPAADKLACDMEQMSPFKTKQPEQFDEKLISRWVLQYLLFNM